MPNLARRPGRSPPGEPSCVEYASCLVQQIFTEVTMALRLLFLRSGGTWGWHLTADNGRIIATDGGKG